MKTMKLIFSLKMWMTLLSRKCFWRENVRFGERLYVVVLCLVLSDEVTVIKTISQLMFFFVFKSSPSPANGELVFKLQSELALKAQEYTQQKQDYEDLLVLLEDQDLKIKKFKVCYPKIIIINLLNIMVTELFSFSTLC